ncbi:MAG: limonene-1,2-epoxide hydrolase family protein [Candidatus Methylacidiphilales bacterium]
MPTPIETVTAFCAEFSIDHGRSAIRKWFTPDTVWVNEGLSVTTGIDEAIALIEVVEKAVGIKNGQFEILAIAADGNRVLTERLDRFQRADGSEIAASKVMGIFEVEGDHIVAWRDYYDTKAAEKLATN